MWAVFCIVNLRNKPRNSHLRFTSSRLGNGELCYEYFSRHPPYYSKSCAIFPPTVLLFRNHLNLASSEALFFGNMKPITMTESNQKLTQIVSTFDEIFDIFLCFFTLFLSSHPKQVRVVFLLKVDFLFSVHSKS